MAGFLEGAMFGLFFETVLGRLWAIAKNGDWTVTVTIRDVWQCLVIGKKRKRRRRTDCQTFLKTRIRSVLETMESDMLRSVHSVIVLYLAV